MLWHSSEDRVLVRVSDARTGDAFSLDVAPHERAYDVFHHPYAFAADPRRRADLTVAAA
jgi:hypothetical protein